MKSDPNTTVFLQTVSAAMIRLKQQLTRGYEQAYPELREVIHLVLDEEELRSWNLTLFPHLLLPDLVEAHIETLNLRPGETKPTDELAPHDFRTYQPVLALCG